MKEKKNSSESQSSLVIEKKDPKLEKLVQLLNIPLKIFIIILINMIGIRNYLSKYNKDIPFLTSYIYVNFLFGMIYSLFLSGNLNLLKTFSFNQVIYFSYLFNVYGFQNLKIMGILNVIFLLIFLRFKVYNLYAYFPNNFFISIKIVVFFMFFFVQIFNFNENLDKFPDKFDFLYLINNFVALNFANFSTKLILFVTMSIFLMFYFKKFNFQRIPETVIFVLIGFCIGLILVKTNKEFQKINFFKDGFDFRSVLISFDKNIWTLGDTSLLTNKRFIIDMFVFSFINLIEFSLSISLLKSNTILKFNIFREFLVFIIINSIQTILGLIPISVDFNSNFQIKNLKGNFKKYYLIVVIFIILFPIILNKIFLFIPFILLSAIFLAMTFSSLTINEFKFLTNFNKSGFFYVIMIIVLAFYYDFFFTVTFLFILFYMCYSPIKNNTSFSILHSVKFFEQKEMVRINNQEKDEENNKLLISEGFEIDERIKTNGIVYIFKKNQFNFAKTFINLNILKEFDEKNIILDFNECLSSDINFLQEYYEILQNLKNSGKLVYLTGFKQKYFAQDNICYSNWIKEEFLNNRILFFN